MTSKYNGDPAARDIIDSAAPVPERKRLLAHGEDLTLDLAARVASNLLKGS